MTDEIVIAPYDPAWPRHYEDEARRLAGALPAGALLALAHVGSTAVPGLAAKPVIDIMGLVESLAAATADYVPLLEAVGYAFWADNPDPRRLFFVRGLPPAPRRTHHLHLVEHRSELECHLSFRDRLRASPETAAAYADLKHRLAAEHAHDREAYTAGKAPFIEAVVADDLKQSRSGCAGRAELFGSRP